LLSRVQYPTFAVQKFVMRTKSIKKNKINIITLGCSKNAYDSEVLAGQLHASGKEVVHEQEGNIVVINTCGFIDNAKAESVNTDFGICR
jgi:ribosomal protein S12 methylthiotransferase